MSSQPLLWAMLIPGLMLISLRLGTLHQSHRELSGSANRWVQNLLLFQLAVASFAFLQYTIDLFRGTNLGLTPLSMVPLSTAGRLIDQLVLVDGVSVSLYLMVSFVGWVVARYSSRHLDGDPKANGFSLWTGLTVAAVSLLVISGHMVLFLTMWVLMSIGLDRLLIHHSERPRVKASAYYAFVVARISDVALAIAFSLLFRETGTLSIAELLSLSTTELLASANLQVACMALVIAAAAKSTLIPFHFWLPQTLESPTPVSALMHAGIVNAGGFLVIRFSPVLVETPWCLAVLACLGLATTCIAGLAMLTQTSIKSKLAYSTIAQMGFMMFQCGLGAFTAALLHIIAHSIYKAYCFLDSGTLATESQRLHARSASALAINHTSLSLGRRAFSGGLIFACTIAVVFGCLVLFGINPHEKAGGLILGTILAAAISRWLIAIQQAEQGSFHPKAIAVAVAVCLIYAGSFSAVNTFTTGSIPAVSMGIAPLWLCMFLAVLAFGTLLWIEQKIRLPGSGRRFQRLYLHASRSFYLDSALQTLFMRLRNS